MNHSIQKLLMIIWLCAITILFSGCARFFNAINIGDGGRRPFIDTSHPYFWGTRSTIKDVGTAVVKADAGMIPFLIVDLPFEFAVDALVELPPKVLVDVTMPLYEYEKKRQARMQKLHRMRMLDLFKEGLHDKRRSRLFYSDDYLKVFRNEVSHIVVGHIDVEDYITVGQRDLDYLALYIDSIVAHHRSQGMKLLTHNKYLIYNMLPVYQYLLEHSLKPSDYQKYNGAFEWETAIWSAVINFYYMDVCEPRQLKLVKLLLKKGCNPNTIADYPKLNAPPPKIEGVPYIHSLTALDLACEYLELSRHKEHPDGTAIKTAKELVELLQRYGAKHSPYWIETKSRIRGSESTTSH